MTTVAGYLSLLEESDSDLISYALTSLNNVVSSNWAEIANHVNQVGGFAKNQSLPYRKLAALVASKIYFFLDKMEESLEYALTAEELFDVNVNSEYVSALVAKAIDTFVNVRIGRSDLSPAAKQAGEIPPPDSRLKQIVSGMFERCYAEGKHKEALGVALESRSLNRIQQSIVTSANKSEMLHYCFEICMHQVSSRHFRHAVFRLLVSIYSEMSNPDYVPIVKILVFLNEGAQIGAILQKLLAGSEQDVLLAYQLAFDLSDSATQQLLQIISDTLAPNPGAAKPASLQKILDILSGTVALELYIDFLAKTNKTDLLILKNIKESLEVRNSVCHNATVLAHSIMQAGTTKDTFLRENLEWLGRATHWAKFSATAGLGVIHKGQVKNGMSLLQSYLPRPNSKNGPYCEGGALYALGLIHTNHGAGVVPYLVEALASSIQSSNNIMQSGACLGLGVAAMGTQNEAILEQLFTVLRSENAVAGEAAGIAIGLVMLASANQTALTTMIQHAHLTDHEKIIRGIAIGCALIMYGQEEAADTLIEMLAGDKDPILRYGGMFAIGMAYCGTANNAAIRRLLHTAVSDVSDDVRRAAVLCLGFLLFRQPELCPKLVSLLAGSYNPHVRYGATLAVGISCAGTSLKAALDLLEPMTRDDKDFVRQGAFIAISMVLIQTSAADEPAVAKFRALFAERIAYKHEPLMAKFGAILASGIIDAGGRNVTIALQSQSGHLNLPGIIGLCLFTQYWYWYPLIHFLSMSFQPTAIIGLTGDLKIPAWSFVSNAPPSRYAYPEPYKAPAAAAPTSIKTAVLSTAKKAQQRAAQKAADKPDAKEKEEEKPTEETAASTTPTAAPSAPEPSSETLQNPARVTPRQLAVISFSSQHRWVPVDASRSKTGGIIILADSQPDQPVLESSTAHAEPTTTPIPSAPSVVETDTIEPPESFELSDDFL